MSKLFIIIFLLLFHSAVNAQFSATLYEEVGKNNASEGDYLKAATFISFKYKKTKIEGGIQADIISNNSNLISGYHLNASRSFFLKPIDIRFQPFWMYTPYGELVFHRDMGLLSIFSWNNWSLSIGIDFKNFGYSSYAVKEYNLEKDHWYKFDNWNLMYKVQCLLLPNTSKFNMCLTLTDFERFLINDSSNPEILLSGKYTIPHWTLFAESSYRAAGFFNLTPTLYGFLVRTGVTFNL